jgi:hypothetical protein
MELAITILKGVVISTFGVFGLVEHCLMLTKMQLGHLIVSLARKLFQSGILLNNLQHNPIGTINQANLESTRDMAVNIAL